MINKYEIYIWNELVFTYEYKFCQLLSFSFHQGDIIIIDKHEYVICEVAYDYDESDDHGEYNQGVSKFKVYCNPRINN